MIQTIRITPWLLICFLLGFTVNGSASPAKIRIPLIMDETRIYAAAEIWYESFAAPVTLTATDVMTTSDLAVSLLSQYYVRAKANQVAELEGMYTDIDGSLNAIKRQIHNNPALYGTYSQLETISVTAKALWGLYQFLPVTLSGAGNSVQWVETLLCDTTKCQMSTSMESMSKDEQIWKNALLFAPQLENLTGHLDPSTFSQMMTTLTLQDRKKVMYPPYAPVGADAYPLNIFVHFIDGQDLLVPIEETEDSPGEDPPQQEIPGAFQALVEMVRAAQAIPNGQLTAALSDRWHGMPGDGYYAMTVKTSNVKDSSYATNLDTAQHSWDAFHLRVKNWESLRLMAMAHGTDKTYLFVEPALINDEGVDSIQLFCARQDATSGHYLFEEDALSDLSLQILKSPAVMQFIDEQYR